MNGDGRDDILGTWPSGVWYRNSITESWVKMSSSANMVAAGDVDGDGKADLIGTWSTGLWVKNSSTSSWTKISVQLPKDIDAKLFEGWDSGASNAVDGFIQFEEGPESLQNFRDVSNFGPNSGDFVYCEDQNLTPNEDGSVERVPGPGEPGFRYSVQKNLVPKESRSTSKKK
jgi:hypothetical protein